jgi:hypothetical protein
LDQWQGTATSSLFSVTGSTTIAPVNLNGTPGTNFAAIPGAGGPTGIVGNSGMSFGVAGGPALFIFAKSKRHNFRLEYVQYK